MNLADAGRQVRDQLAAAAALGDDRTREIAAALSQAADSAVRLTILDALTTASTELADALREAATARGILWAPELSVQLDGDRLGFAVALSQPDTAPAAGRAEDAGGPDRGEATARISLRLSESLKAAIEQAADRAELSVNSWLVRLAAGAIQDDGSRPGADARSAWHGNRGGKRVTGWITG